MPMEYDWNVLCSILWCATLAVLALVYLVWLALRSDYDWWETCLYVPVYLMGRLLWRVHFTNSAPEALAHGGVLVANHRSSVDPFFVQLAARRRVHWMVASEYCTHPIFGPFLRLFEVIPTNRSGIDTASTKQAMRLATAGRLVGMFPEGQLNHTKLPLLPVRSGAAAVAAKANRPIIPLYIEGSPYFRTVWSPVFMRARVGITFGDPVYPQTAQSDDGGSLPDPLASDAANADDQLADTDRMILQWARQVVTMAGYPNFPVSLAAKRIRRKRRS